MSEITDVTKKRVEQLTEFINDDRIERGPPDVGYKSDLTIEDFQEAFIEGALDVLVNLPVTQYDERDHETHPMDVTAPDNVVRIYFTDPPWQAPIVILECKELPGYAKISSTEDVWFRPHDAHPKEQTWARFQIREAHNWD